ncbi:MAG: adenylate/guanylate cyclase domain-containing protein [Firmicutes bacterium]|nr:adenylate/guanylate cyclase domain-containing protein [Bacillota bacterium]
MYDYDAGKERIRNILNMNQPIKEVRLIPSDDNFTYDNGIRAWVTSVFVDLRNSTKLFKEVDELKVSKIIRSFTSEVIEIMRDNEKHKEIGIRGDCVYGIFSTPDKVDMDKIFEMAAHIHTLVKYLSNIFCEHNFPSIKAGIGIGSEEVLVIKTGRKGTGINDKVWIGGAVIRASKNSDIGAKIDFPINPTFVQNCTSDVIVVDEIFYINLNEGYQKKYFKKRNINNNIVYTSNATY